MTIQACIQENYNSKFKRCYHCRSIIGMTSDGDSIYLDEHFLPTDSDDQVPFCSEDCIQDLIYLKAEELWIADSRKPSEKEFYEPDVDLEELLHEILKIEGGVL